jgi:hypothetical protein
MQGPLHKSLSTTRQYLDCNYRSPGSIEHAAIGSRISSPISRRSRQQRLCSNYVISWMDNAEHAPQLRRSQPEVACPAASCAILLDRRRSEDRTGLKGGKFSSPVPFVALEQSEEVAFPMNAAQFGNAIASIRRTTCQLIRNIAGRRRRRDSRTPRVDAQPLGAGSLPQGSELLRPAGWDRSSDASVGYDRGKRRRRPRRNPRQRERRHSSVGRATVL